MSLRPQGGFGTPQCSGRRRPGRQSRTLEIESSSSSATNWRNDEPSMVRFSVSHCGHSSPVAIAAALWSSPVNLGTRKSCCAILDPAADAGWATGLARFLDKRHYHSLGAPQRVRRETVPERTGSGGISRASTSAIRRGPSRTSGRQFYRRVLVRAGERRRGQAHFADCGSPGR
jgi:hypothetical protein